MKPRRNLRKFHVATNTLRRRPSAEQKALVKRLAEIHLDIERDMIETYKKMAEIFLQILLDGHVRFLHAHHHPFFSNFPTTLFLKS